MNPLQCLLLLFALLCIACENNVSDTLPAPERVRLISKVNDTTEVSLGIERGIDAENPPNTVPGNETPNGIYLQWERVNGEILRYDIFRRADNPNGDFQLIDAVFTETELNDTSYFDSAVLELDKTYYYSVRAVNRDDVAGEQALPDYYTLLPKPSLRYPTVETQQYNASFSWVLGGLAETYFIFRLEKLGVREYVPYIAFLRDITGNIQAEQHWTLQQMAQDSTYVLSPGSYRWRIDVRKLDDIRRGAESNWGFFRVLP